ncbi:MAG: hypothetical protein J6M60_03835 [Clostridia bacterium]|nr:hypothetical protein [Clostridia bacterium]
MKRILNLVLVVMLLVTGLFVLTGCGNEQVETNQNSAKESSIRELKFDTSKYTKEVQTYNLKSLNDKAQATFSFVKDSDFEKILTGRTYQYLFRTKDGVSIRLDFSNGKLYASNRSSGKLEKEDFSDDKYFDFSKYKVNGYEGWQVFSHLSDNTVFYRTQLFLEELEDDVYTYVQIEIEQGNNLAAKDFDVVKYVNSDDFQYLLNSIKLVK